MRSAKGGLSHFKGYQQSRYTKCVSYVSGDRDWSGLNLSKWLPLDLVVMTCKSLGRVVPPMHLEMANIV